MLFFYIRHGDPIYDPDSLTALGHEQAKSVAKRLALYGLDKIFASTSNRAMQTAQPTCDLLKKDMTLVDFANEGHAWNELTIEAENGRTWLFQSTAAKTLFSDSSIRQLGDEWYNHPEFEKYNYKKGIDRICEETDKFFLSLGYEHIKGSGKYKIEQPNDDRVALFAHQGFGIAFLSCLLDIPYPQFANHFDMCHTGITVIEFRDEGGFAFPRVLTLSSDSHLYRDGLPTNYHNRLRF